MATVAIVAADVPAAGLAQATLVSQSGRRLTFAYAPVGAILDGDAPAFTQLRRVGRKPLNVLTSGQLRTWAGEVLFADLDYRVSVQAQVDALRAIAGDGEVVVFSYGGPEQGRWRITSCPITVQLRTAGGDIARAAAALTLTEAVDVTPAVGPTSGGKKPAPPTRHLSAAERRRPHPGAPHSYVIRQGDSWSRIAAKVYHAPNDRHRIADANHMRDTRAARLPVGRRIRIP
jgi:nucleoid-associated protein YgaU